MGRTPLHATAAAAQPLWPQEECPRRHVPLSLPSPQSGARPRPRVGTHLRTDGQPPEAVPLEDVRACVVHHHVGPVLLERLLQVPLHLLKVFIILRAPVQLYLPPDGLWVGERQRCPKVQMGNGVGGDCLLSHLSLALLSHSSTLN